MKTRISVLSSPRLLASLFLAGLLCQLVGCGVDETPIVADLKAIHSGLIMSKDADGKVTAINNLPAETEKITEVLALLTKLEAPKSITMFDASGVTAEHIKTIAGLKKLVHLELHNAPIGDADIASLAGHPSLESLYVINSNVTGAAMPDFAKIPKLGLLSVSGTKVEGGYENLDALEKFEWLIIGGLTIDEEDAKNISSNSTITHVTMDKTDISDSALKILKSNPKCTVDGSTTATAAAEPAAG